MPFTCTLPDFDPEIHDETLSFGIGYDDVSNYTVIIAFEPLDEGRAEFSFTLFRHNIVTDTTIPLNSGLESKVFIEGQDRKLIISAVCQAIPMLLEHVKPEWVFRCTYDADLPDKALEKHAAIADAFRACGYEEFEVEERAGCKACWMWNDPDNGSLPTEE